ncbi:MAG TPA: 16S rRNA (guanine(966)-N(2))-methyltransferase RsmD [Gammaproteobacteria bacterium]|nr:16S rRNA (guanine(966)-N(2))-methyltransferase RsmD [Gammaproteobacteria bacterium]
MKTKRKLGEAPGSVRIIGGLWRGRRLGIPAGAAMLRPTPDRVRETLFNWLRAEIEGAACADLFAGTGVLGFEALSRGADEVWLVERDRGLWAMLESHSASLGAGSRAHVLRDDAAGFLAAAAEPRFDLVFLDPPFADPIEPLLAALRPRLREGALIYVERPAEPGLPEVAEAEWVKRGRAASVAFGLLRFAG